MIYPRNAFGEFLGTDFQGKQHPLHKRMQNYVAAYCTARYRFRLSESRAFDIANRAGQATINHKVHA